VLDPHRTHPACEIRLIESSLEKEANAIDRGVDSAWRLADLGQVNLEAAKILAGDRVRRFAKELRQQRHCAKMRNLCRLGKTARRHVFDHAPPQRGDAWVVILDHGVLLSVFEARRLKRQLTEHTPSAKSPVLRYAINLERSPTARAV